MRRRGILAVRKGIWPKARTPWRLRIRDEAMENTYRGKRGRDASTDLAVPVAATRASWSCALSYLQKPTDQRELSQVTH